VNYGFLKTSADPKEMIGITKILQNKVTRFIFIIILFGIFISIMVWQGYIKPLNSNLSISPVLLRGSAVVEEGNDLEVSTADGLWTLYVPDGVIDQGLLIYLTPKEIDLFSEFDVEIWNRPSIVQFQVLQDGQPLSSSHEESLLLCYQFDVMKWEKYIHSPNNYFFQSIITSSVSDTWTTIPFTIESNRRRLCSRITSTGKYSIAILGTNKDSPAQEDPYSINN